MSLRFLNDKEVYEQRINGLPVLFQLKVNKDKVAISQTLRRFSQEKIIHLIFCACNAFEQGLDCFICYHHIDGNVTGLPTIGFRYLFYSFSKRFNRCLTNLLLNLFVFNRLLNLIRQRLN